MIFGILSDIHGNLEALEKVIAELSEKNVARYVCGGDIVGYGANPSECIQIIRDLDCIIVAGNHDYAAVELTSIEYFNDHAQAAIQWTRERLTKEEKGFLSQLPLVHRQKEFMLTHATPLSPHEWNYIYTTYEAALNMKDIPNKICFVGHSHIPITFICNTGCTYSFPKKIVIDNEHKYMVNVGSVGQPRDGDSRASYLTYDSDTDVIELHRVEYNVETAQNKIIDAGLPEILAVRLLSGA